MENLILMSSFFSRCRFYRALLLLLLLVLLFITFPRCNFYEPLRFKMQYSSFSRYNFYEPLRFVSRGNFYRLQSQYQVQSPICRIRGFERRSIELKQKQEHVVDRHGRACAAPNILSAMRPRVCRAPVSHGGDSRACSNGD